jgi:hypothetical protein
MNPEKIIGKNISAEAAVKSAGLKIGNDGNISHETYNHEEIMDQMVKAIEFTKMDKKIRSVLLLRLIHGFSIERMQIYLFFHGHFTGNSRDELVFLEAEGKRLVMETLKNNSMQDIIESINANSRVIRDLRNELPTPKLNLDGLA